MRQSLWVINTSLIFLLLAGESVFFFTKVSIPHKASLEPAPLGELERKLDVSVDVKKIYGANDLFGTYIPQVPVVDQQAAQERVPVMPEVPREIPLSIPNEKQPVFIAPLAATLKGVVYLQDDQIKSVAIIQMNDSKAEANYHVGDMILDAQIIKILPNKILVVRSGGQQEALYLREDEAQQDLDVESQEQLDTLKIPHKNGVFYIPVESFHQQVTSLGMFVDLLDITTVYRKGQVLGCRIGKNANNTLSAKLGLDVDDIILKIDNIPVTTLDSRVDIYDHILEKKAGESVVIELERAERHISYVYKLVDSLSDISVKPDTSKKDTTAIDEKKDTEVDIEEQKRKILEKKLHMAPTTHQIEMAERQKMMHARSKKNMLSNRNV